MLTATQKEYLAGLAKTDPILFGQVMAHLRAEIASRTARESIATFDGEVTRLPPGAAYGARGTFKRRSGAMPMGFYRQAGVAV